MRKLSFGLSLLEVVIFSAIAFTIGVLLTSILVNSIGVFSQQRSNVDSGVSLNNALAIINRDILQASQVALGYPDVNPQYLSTATTLVMKLPSQNNTGIVSGVYDYIIITPDSKNPHLLKRLIFPDGQSTRLGANQLITPLLDSISFTYLDATGQAIVATSATKVGVNITTLAQTGSLRSKQSSSIIVSLRNLP